MLRLTCPEACLIVLEFTSSVCGSSLFLFLLPLLFFFRLFLGIPSYISNTVQQNRKSQTDNDAKKAETYKNCRTHKY